MVSLVAELANVFPFTSGLAGFAFECSRYAKEDSETYAWQASMSHPGIDIVRLPVDAKAPGIDAVRGINWLTLVGAPIVQSLGGASRLQASLGSDIEVLDCRHGVVIKAGLRPAIGDVNRGDVLPLYRRVYRVLAAYVEVAARRSMSFHLTDDYVERTEAWYRRFQGE